jgi:hypothetical protein
MGNDTNDIDIAIDTMTGVQFCFKLKAFLKERCPDLVSQSCTFIHSFIHSF